MANPKSFVSSHETTTDVESNSAPNLNPPAETTNSAAKRPLPEEFADTENSTLAHPLRNHHPNSSMRTWRILAIATYPCIIQVDDNPFMGFSGVPRMPVQPYLKIDCGILGSPLFSLIIHSPRAKTVEIAQVNGGVDDFMAGRWLVHNLEIQHVKDLVNDRDGTLADQRVIEAFEANQPKCLDRLTCITKDVHDAQSKFCKPKIWDMVDEEHYHTLADLFNESRSYKIRIWFTVPLKFPQTDSWYLCRPRAGAPLAGFPPILPVFLTPLPNLPIPPLTNLPIPPLPNLPIPIAQRRYVATSPEHSLD